MTLQPMTTLSRDEFQALVELCASRRIGETRWDRRYLRKMWEVYRERGVVTMTQYARLRRLMQGVQHA